jgi:hypothetical protein
MDSNGFFEKVDGEYRVYDVKILDKASGEYKALDPNGKYVIAGFNYYLIDFGGGMAMFKDAKILDAEGVLDVEMLENYIVEHLGGVIGEEYAEVKKNITFTDGNEAPYPPHTADGSRVAAWGFMAIISLSCLTALVAYRRKQVQ